MNTSETIKIISFWQKSLKKEGLFDRDIIKDIDLKSKEIIDLIGPRRSGKSTILNLIINKLKLKNFLYLNFEDPFFVENNQAKVIDEFIEIYQEYYSKNLKYIFFDEIQNIKNWENAIRKLRDAGKYKIFITGSSSKLLSREVSSLLTGRHLSYSILPLSFKEFLNFKKITINNKRDLILHEKNIFKYFQEYKKIGGFPEAVLTSNQEILKNYFYDILYKDIVVRYNVRNKDILEKIALFLLSNASKIVSIETIKKNYQIDFQLTSNYINYIKEAFLIFNLPQFFYSLKKQEKSLKKIYSIDTGLVNATSFRFSENFGRILENIVFLEFKRNKKEIYYFHGKQECDFIIKKNLKINQAVQVVAELNEDNKKRELKGLLEAMQVNKLKEGLILTENQEKEFKIDNNKITIMPVYKWLINET